MKRLCVFFRLELRSTTMSSHFCVPLPLTVAAAAPASVLVVAVAVTMLMLLTCQVRRAEGEDGHPRGREGRGCGPQGRMGVSCAPFFFCFFLFLLPPFEPFFFSLASFCPVSRPRILPRLSPLRFLLPLSSPRRDACVPSLGPFSPAEPPLPMTSTPHA